MEGTVLCAFHSSRQTGHLEVSLQLDCDVRTKLQASDCKHDPHVICSEQVLQPELGHEAAGQQYNGETDKGRPQACHRNPLSEGLSVVDGRHGRQKLIEASEV